MNEDLINNLEILYKYYSLLWIKNKQSKDNFRKIAYSKAIKELKNLKFNIKDINEVKNISGIGKSILDKIKEYLETGNIKKVLDAKICMNIRDDKEKIIEDFLNIWGVGEVKAKLLYEKGYRTIDDIRKNDSILNRQQLIGLKYYEDLKQKIPRINIVVIQTIIKYIINKDYGKNSYIMEVAGSYRRGKDYSSDIDIILTSKLFNLNDIVELLMKWGVITDILSMKNEKFMGVGRCPKGNEPYFRIDIEFLPKEEYAYGLLYFTGSKDFNREIRQHAKKLGYTLNQHGLKNNKNGEWLEAKTEDEIFKILNLAYLKPCERN